MIGLRYEIGRSLAADLEVLDLAEVAPQAAARLARGALHDADEPADRGHAEAQRPLGAPDGAGLAGAGAAGFAFGAAAFAAAGS